MTQSLQSLKARLLEGKAVFTIAEASQYIDDVLACGAIDTNDRFYRRFFYEFRPLVAIANAVGPPDIRIVFTASGERIDAIFDLGGNNAPRNVEMTTAVDGQREALMMEHLDVHGFAPVLGEIKATGTRAAGNRRIECADVRAYKYPDEISSRMEAALSAKKQKALSNPHYRGAWLGIAIPDFPPAPFKKSRLDPVCSRLLASPEAFVPFSRVFVVSVVGDYLFDSAGIPLTASVR